MIYRSIELDKKKYLNTRNQCLELLKTKRLVVSTQKVVQVKQKKGLMSSMSMLFIGLGSSVSPIRRIDL